METRLDKVRHSSQRTATGSFAAGSCALKVVEERNNMACCNEAPAPKPLPLVLEATRVLQHT